MTQDVRGTERRAWVAFSVGAVLATAIGWLIYANSRRLHDGQEAMARSHETMTTLVRTLSGLQEVESGARGYVLTGNQNFLEPHVAGAERVTKDLADLKLLTRGDPAQTERLATLEALAAEQVDISRALVAVRDAEGPDVAQRLVAAGGSKEAMDAVRAVVATMDDAEEARGRSLTAASDAATRNTLILTGGLAVLSLTLFALLLGAIMRALRNLAGGDIPLSGRIVSVCDVFDALTHERPYKHAWPVEQALAEIAAHRGLMFEPRIADAFFALPDSFHTPG